MKTSLCCFELDIAGEGVATVVRNARDRAGVEGLTLAVGYHHGRDVFPHNPRGRALFHDGDSVAFRPDASKYGHGIPVPRPSRIAAEQDVLAATTVEARRSEMDVRAWIVYLHNESVGASDEELVVRNAFGDRDRTKLCPANPRVQDYAAALTADVCRYDIGGILAESLSFHPFDYGYHHERDFLERDNITSFLLGLCFCGHCAAAGASRGVEVDAVASAVRDHLERALSITGSEPAARAELTAPVEPLLSWPDLRAFLGARADSVETLVARVGTAAGPVPVSVVDPGGALPAPFANSDVGVEDVPGWCWGLSAAAFQGGVEIEAIGYAVEADDVAGLLSGYRRHGLRASLALRPMSPDCASVDNLRQKVHVARALEVRMLDLYHYGLAPLNVLDRISAAIN